MRSRVRIPSLLPSLVVASWRCPPTAGADGKAAFPGLDQRLVGQSKLLVGFTAHFKVDAESYNRLAAAAGRPLPHLGGGAPAALRVRLRDRQLRGRRGGAQAPPQPRLRARAGAQRATARQRALARAPRAA